MNSIYYYTYISVIIVILLTTVYIVITAKNITKNRKTKYLVISLFSTLVLSVLFVNIYYDEIFRKQVRSINELLNTNNKVKSSSQLIDSLNILELEKIKLYNQKLIDSIKKQNTQLLKYKKEVENIEKIIGQKQDVKSEIMRKVTNNNESLDEIEKYNKRVENNIVEKRRGYTYSGNSSKILFKCPSTINYQSDILVLSMVFIDDNIVKDVAYIIISFSEKINDKEYKYISEDIFEPQKGKNIFKIKNQFKNRQDQKIKMQIAYVLKSELEKEYPRVEQITCKNY